MNISMAIDYANYLDRIISEIHQRIDEYNKKKDKSIEIDNEDGRLEFINDIENKNKTFEKLIKEKKEWISSLVEDYKIQRCIYCSEWTHIDAEVVVPYSKDKIFCSESCKRFFHEDMS